jgi:uncharacterized protein YbaR (Trm112 family)
MVIVFGWGQGAVNDRGEVAPVVCPNCHNDVFLHHIHTEKKVSLYFVPLVPYGATEYLVCPICRQGLQIPPEKRHAVDEMQAATALLRRGGLTPDFYRTKAEVFWRMMGVAASGEQVVQAAPTIPPPRPSPVAPAEDGSAAVSSSEPEPSMAEQLQGLAELHADGTLTDEEFAAAKARLIGG